MYGQNHREDAILSRNAKQADLAEIAARAEAVWEWRNLRQVGIGLTLWPFDWRLNATKWDDKFGGSMTVLIGPFDLTISYNCGTAGVARLAS